jgi:hypothetical protein
MMQQKLLSRLKPGLAFLLLICLFGVQPKAQNAVNAPAAKLLTTFKFEMLSGGIIILRGQLDNFPDTLNFILDTGSGGISLDSLTTEYLKLDKTPSEKVIRGIGGVKAVVFALNHNLKLRGLEVNNLDFHINDYTLLTSVYGIKIDGIIGYSFLRRYIVSINYDENVIAIYSPGTFKYPRGGHLLNPNFTSIPIQPAVVYDGKTFRNNFYFDSGAGLCFLLSDSFISDSSVLAKNKQLLATQAEGLGGKRPMQLTVVRSVKIGPYKFRKVPTYVFKDEYNVTGYPSTGGLLGNDLLRRFNVVLNYPAQAIHLKPNKSFDHPFDYSYTGFGIYLENGDVIVDDVMKDSPAEKAGLKCGDKMIAVAGNFSRNIQVYRTLLQNSDSKLKLIVSRDGVLTELTLKVKNILDSKY